MCEPQRLDHRGGPALLSNAIDKRDGRFVSGLAVSRFLHRAIAAGSQAEGAIAVTGGTAPSPRPGVFSQPKTAGNVRYTRDHRAISVRNEAAIQTSENASAGQT